MPWPSFSIVVPTYQRRDLVCEAVRALARVSYSGALELIVVVDGSTDGTATALASIACPFPMRVIERPNGGAGEARNWGAAAAQGDIILFLDDDMMAEAGLVEEHARTHLGGADAVIGKVTIDPGSPPGFLPDSVARWITAPRASSPLRPFDIFTGQLSVRRAAFEELGGFDPALTSGSAFGNEDADFGVKLLARYDARYNEAAVTRQRYVVTPREYMRRTTPSARADLDFIASHPELAGQFLELKGVTRPLTRFVYRPLSRIPLVPKLLSASAVWAAEAAMKTPFRSNRLLARYFSGSRSIAYWAEVGAQCQPFGRERLLALCYHAIRDQSDDPVMAAWGVAPDLLAEQLDFLSSAGFAFVSASCVANFFRHGAPLPKRALLLTFDDCHESLLEIARNLLQPRKIPALAFAVTGVESGTNEWDQAYGGGRHKLLNGEQLRDLAALGVEIGSHSRTHREMPPLDAREQEEEARDSADELAELGLPRPRFFAYPYGSLDTGSIRAVKDAGYLAAFGCEWDRISRNSDSFALPRVVIMATDRGWRFRLKVRRPRLFAKLERLAQGLKNRSRRIGRALSGNR